MEHVYLRGDSWFAHKPNSLMKYRKQIQQFAMFAACLLSGAAYFYLNNIATAQTNFVTASNAQVPHVHPTFKDTKKVAPQHEDSLEERIITLPDVDLLRDVLDKGAESIPVLSVIVRIGNSIW